MSQMKFIRITQKYIFVKILMVLITFGVTSKLISLPHVNYFLWALSIVKLFDYKTYDIYMNTSRKLCKIWLCHNLELEIFKYLSFYLFFELKFLSGNLKLHTLLTVTQKMIENWWKLYEFINWNVPLLEISVIFIIEKVKQ